MKSNRSFVSSRWKSSDEENACHAGSMGFATKDVLLSSITGCLDDRHRRTDPGSVAMPRLPVLPAYTLHEQPLCWHDAVLACLPGTNYDSRPTLPPLHPCSERPSGTALQNILKNPRLRLCMPAQLGQELPRGCRAAWHRLYPGLWPILWWLHGNMSSKFIDLQYSCFWTPGFRKESDGTSAPAGSLVLWVLETEQPCAGATVTMVGLSVPSLVPLSCLLLIHTGQHQVCFLLLGACNLFFSDVGFLWHNGMVRLADQ